MKKHTTRFYLTIIILVIAILLDAIFLSLNEGNDYQKLCKQHYGKQSKYHTHMGRQYCLTETQAIPVIIHCSGIIHHQCTLNKIQYEGELNAGNIQ